MDFSVSVPEPVKRTRFCDLYRLSECTWAVIVWQCEALRTFRSRKGNRISTVKFVGDHPGVDLSTSLPVKFINSSFIAGFAGNICIDRKNSFQATVRKGIGSNAGIIRLKN